MAHDMNISITKLRNENNEQANSAMKVKKYHILSTCDAEGSVPRMRAAFPRIATLNFCIKNSNDRRSFVAVLIHVLSALSAQSSPVSTSSPTAAISNEN
jgi:hypothetical protein